MVKKRSSVWRAWGSATTTSRIGWWRTAYQRTGRDQTRHLTGCPRISTGAWGALTRALGRPATGRPRLLRSTGVLEPAADPWAGDRLRLDGQRQRAYARRPVLLALVYALLRLLIDLIVVRGRPSADRDLELLVLRQELLVLRRAARRPRWRQTDRMIMAALGRRLPAGVPLLVQPATLLGWHRALVRRRWAAFGRRRGPGRPPLPAECQELVLRLARENPAGAICASAASCSSSDTRSPPPASATCSVATASRLLRGVLR